MRHAYVVGVVGSAPGLNRYNDPDAQLADWVGVYPTDGQGLWRLMVPPKWWASTMCLCLWTATSEGECELTRIFGLADIGHGRYLSWSQDSLDQLADQALAKAVASGLLAEPKDLGAALEGEEVAGE